MTIQLALFKGISPVSRMIRFFTRSEFSHAGFIIDGKLYETWNHRGGLGRYWGLGSWRNHTPGTQVSIMTLPLSDAQQIAVEAGVLALAMRRERYNWLGVLDFIVRILPERHVHKSFCSEGCWKVLSSALGLAGIPPEKVSPDVLEMLVRCLGGITIRCDVVEDLDGC